MNLDEHPDAVSVVGESDAGHASKPMAALRSPAPSYDATMAHPADPRTARGAERSTAAPADEAATPKENSRSATLGQLRSRYPEMDWSDPEGALETLAVLHDADAMAELEEAENDIATGNLLPLDRYAPPR